MLGRKSVIGAILTLFVCVALQGYYDIDIQTFYKQQCQMSCMDYEVDKHRTDLWDLRFLRFHLCTLGYVPNCTLPYSFPNLCDVSKDNSDLRISMLNKDHKEITEPDEIRSTLYYFIQTFMNDKSKTEVIYEIQAYHNAWEFFYFRFYHRWTRFNYCDFLDFGLDENKRLHNMTFKISMLDEDEVKNIFILGVLCLKYKLSKNNNISLKVGSLENMSIGTFVFDQRSIIFTEGSNIYSWVSTFLTICSLVIMFFFIRKFLISLHGCTETYTFSRFNMNNCNLTMPDLIPVGRGNLSIFRSYFYSTVLGAYGCFKAVVFVFVFIIWFYSAMSYSELSTEYYNLDKNLCVLLLLICPLSLLKLVPAAVVFLLCLALVFFTPLFIFHMDLFVSYYHYSLYLFGLFSLCCCTCPFPFYFPLKLLLDRNLVELLLWPTWPVQMLVFLTRLITKQDSVLKRIWIASFVLLSGLGLTLVPQYASPPMSMPYYDPKNLHILSYWLFFPFYFMLKTFFDSYKRNIYVVIEAVFTTLTIAYLSYYLLCWLYPLMKMLNEKELVAILILTLVNDILEISREWYQKYDKFLKDVVSYIRKKYTCTDNTVQLATRQGDIALAFNHTDIGQCQHHEVNQGRVNVNQFEIKGLLLFVKDSTVNIPSDFFFQIIKIQGGPGEIKCVVLKELISLILGLFPAFFMYWLCIVIYLADFEKYDPVVTLVFGGTFISQYKKLFLHRKTPDFDVKDNSEMEREIDNYLHSYQSSCFVVEEIIDG